MRRSWITLGVMLALVAALGLWVTLRPANDQPAGERVSALTVESAQALRIEWPGKATIEMRKENGGWRIVAPQAARADGMQVERMLAVLGATAEMTLPATDLARFDLDEARPRLTVNGESLTFGGLNPVTGGVYVLKGGKVLLLAPRYAAIVPSDPQTLFDRRLLAGNEVPTGFSFPQFSVQQQDGGWRVVPPDAGLSQDDVLRWVEGWRLASALRVERHEGDPPASRITVRLRDGRSFAVGVSERDGEIAFTRYDEKMRYYFFANSARRLLAPPSVALSGDTGVIR